MILIIDNYDSFTFNLVDYFEQLGCQVLCIRNDNESYLTRLNEFSAVVLSPGPGTPSKANLLMRYIKQIIAQEIPVLGICLGHQALGEFFGMKLIKAEKPMHGKISILRHFNDPIFKEIPEDFEVVRYHSLVLQNIIEPLYSLCFTQKNELMGFRHNTLPVVGLQFHPESVLTKYGMKILKNWFGV